MALPSFPHLAVFMALVLVLSLYGLTASGHFPEEHRSDSLKSAGGRLVLWGTIILCGALTIVTLAFAWQYLPLPSAIFGGGAMVLFAPLLLQPLPDAFVDGRRGLLTFSLIGVGLALAAGTIVA
jgi:hypothetical protein